MNDTTEQNDPGISEMDRHQLPPPTAELKERVLGAARSAWAEAVPESEEVLWLYPVLRLAASVVLTMGLVHFANSAGRESTGLEPGALRGLDARARLAVMAASLPSEKAAEALVAHQRRVDSILQATAGRNG